MKKTKKKLALKRTTLRVLSGPDLQGVAGGTTIILTVATTSTTGVLGITGFCAPRDDRDLAGRSA